MKTLLLLVVGVGLALAVEPPKPAAKPKEKAKEKAPASEVDTSSLPAYQESVEKLGTKVMDDVDDTIKKLNQEALEIE